MARPRRNRRLATREPGGRLRAGFTLIELMAVVAIMTMIFAIGVPRLAGSKWRALKNEAESIATSIDYARQSAIMTGVPHRLLIDLEDGGYRVEWLVSEEQAFAAVVEDEPETTPTFDPLSSGLVGEEKIPLRPPPRAEREFFPVPNRQLGSFTWLDDALYFVGLENSNGWIEGGDVWIRFDADGTTESALLEIADADDHHMTLEIEPLLDRVRRRDGPARS